MFGSYLKSAIRDLRQHRLVGLINVFGLAIGLAACLLMYSYIQHELGYDKLHDKHENIYRLNEIQTFSGMTPQNVALSMYPMGPALKSKFPQIRDFVRLIAQENRGVWIDEELLYIPKLYVVDDSFFDIFDFPMKYGNSQEALNNPNGIVLTEDTAVELFGEENPIGRQLRFPRGVDSNVVVTGVLENVTPQSHFQFDALVSIATMGSEYNTRNLENWGGNWLNTYLLLNDTNDIGNLESQLPEFVIENMGEERSQFYELYLQALPSIHLDSSNITHDYQNVNKSNRSYIYIFFILAIFVLVIAVINFMNLTSARLSSRIKELSIRKTLGATQSQVIVQLLGESILYSMLAVVIAVLLTWTALPIFNATINRELGLNLFSDMTLALVILATTLLTGILSGIYPAISTSSINPAQALKTGLLRMGKKQYIQNGLVTLQFAVSVAMIVATILVLQQLSFIQNQNIGFNKEQVLLLPIDSPLRQNFSTFKQELLSIPGVSEVTASSQRLGNNLHQGGFQVLDDGPVIDLIPSNIRVEMDYLSFHEIEVIEGRDFSREFATDFGQAFVINEAMLRFLQWESIDGKNMTCCGNEEMGSVIGLVKDFNFNSLHHEVQPLVIHATDIIFNEISLKLSGAALTETLIDIEQKWNESGATVPFSYEFLDDHFEELYAGDQQASFVVSSISILTIIIACLGLFGLTSLSLEKRKKEIGMRKVLGADVADIVILLNREFSLLVFVAIVIATPIVWYFMNNWLNSFAYRVDISVWAFIAGGVSAALIAFLTISSRVIQTTRANPIDALRNE